MIRLFPFFASVKVLVLHQHFKDPYKGGAIRSYYLAKALVDRNITVTVISIHSSPEFKTENLEGIEVHYLPVSYDNRFKFAQRSRSFLKYVLGVVKRPELFKGVDVCYAISTPLTIGLAALWIKKRYGIPFLFEVGDLWPDAPVEMGFVKNPLLKWSLFTLEKILYREAIAIVALSVSIQKAISRKAPDKTIYLIPNMADTQFYRPEPKLPELEQKFDVRGKFVVSYIGAVGFANGLDYFVECARASQRASLPIHFLLCGDGAILDNLKHFVKQLGLQNFSFIPFQNREGVKEVMNVTDACFICYRPFRILETGSPNKYFDALAAGKLVIINFGGWIKDEIEKNKCGVYVDSRHPTDFIKKVTPFMEDTVELKAYQTAGRTLAEKNYSRSILSERFAGIFKTLRFNK